MLEGLAAVRSACACGGAACSVLRGSAVAAVCKAKRSCALGSAEAGGGLVTLRGVIA